MTTQTTTGDHRITARRERTRSRLFAAAGEIFSERGVAGASVEEICERAGFTRGAFYSNFDSIDDLCAAFLRDQCERQIADAEVALHGARPGSSDPDDIARRVVSMLLEAPAFQVDQLMLATELRLHALRRPELRQGYLEMREVSAGTFAGILTGLAADLDVQPMLSSEDTLWVFGALFESGLLEMALRDDPAQMHAAFAERISTVVRLLLTPR